MDDTYLKSIFWTLVILYTVAIIGVWESLVKPIWFFLLGSVWPLISNLLVASKLFNLS